MNLEEKVQELEKKRLRLRFWFFLSLALCFLGISGTLLYAHISDIKPWVLAGLFLLIPFFTYLYLRRKWVRLFKGEFLVFLFKTFFPDLTYSMNDYIPLELFNASKLFADKPRPDRYDGGDLVQGKVNGVTITFSRVNAEYKTETTDDEGNTETHWHRIFRGIFFVVRFPKRTRGIILVYPNAFRLFRTPAGLERVKLEDPEFEKHFDVFASDQIEARYILSLSFMRRILEFVLKTEAQARFSFMDDHMFCAMNFGKEFFKAPSFLHSVYPLIYQEQFRNYLQEIELLISLVEELNLSQNIWLETV